MGELVLCESFAGDGLVAGWAGDELVFVLSSVPSPVEMSREGGEAVDTRVAGRKVGEADVFAQQSARDEGLTARRVSTRESSSHGLAAMLLREVLRESSVLVERLTAARDSAVVGAVVGLHVTSEMSGGEECTATACLLTRVPSVIGVREEVAMEVLCPVEGSSTAAMGAAVQTSVGVGGEVAVQLPQLVVRFVAAGMRTDVRTI